MSLSKAPMKGPSMPKGKLVGKFGGTDREGKPYRSVLALMRFLLGLAFQAATSLLRNRW
jgi:hypothetical protein